MMYFLRQLILHEVINKKIEIIKTCIFCQSVVMWKKNPMALTMHGVVQMYVWSRIYKNKIDLVRFLFDLW